MSPTAPFSSTQHVPPPPTDWLTIQTLFGCPHRGCHSFIHSCRQGQGHHSLLPFHTCLTNDPRFIHSFIVLRPKSLKWHLCGNIEGEIMAQGNKWWKEADQKQLCVIVISSISLGWWWLKIMSNDSITVWWIPGDTWGLLIWGNYGHKLSLKRPWYFLFFF